MEPPHVESLAHRTVYRSPIFEVTEESIRLPSGLRQDLALVRHGGAVCIAPVLADGRLVCIRQYRHAAGDWLLEIPAGRLEEGEDEATAARRELEEETGYRSAAWTRGPSFYAAPGFCSEVLHLFVARDLKTADAASRLAPDDDEELETVAATPEELLAGAARDAKTLVAAALLAAGRLP